MPGPIPKAPGLRQRRNRVSTAATLPAESSLRVAPALPRRVDEDGGRRRWNRLTLAWWKDIWRSPMASEFLQADVHGLYLLAELMDSFWESPSLATAAEIRQHRMAFGLTPIDRRRLQWEVERVESRKRPDASEKPKMNRRRDPRQLLRAVK